MSRSVAENEAHGIILKDGAWKTEILLDKETMRSKIGNMFGSRKEILTKRKYI